jgi:hypothetical protein
MMEFDEKTVSIYFDTENNNLYFIPFGPHEKFGVMQIDIVNELTYPYSDEEIEEVAFKTLNQCHTLLPSEDKRTPLEKHLKIRGLVKATKNKKSVSLDWEKEKGYIVTPFKKVGRGGYLALKSENWIYLGHELQTGQLAKAIKKAIELSQL